ncbi:MAG: hypothetical protein LM584_03595 [Desulfurococcaceae archaeon]|nr:hypothetical protein [Desulfurococcaceae archaeon]
MDYVAFLWSLLVLASLDSFNPCAMSMTATIALAASSLGLHGFAMLRYPLLFVCGVYIGYLLVGLVASWVLGFSRVLLVFVVLLAFILALLDLREALSERSAACRVGECAPPWLKLLDPRTSPLLLVTSGIVVSWSFMMCSAAPYLIFLGILGSTVGSPALRLVLIAIYCLIVIAPLILIAIAPVAIFEKVTLSYRGVLVVRSALLVLVALIGVYYIYMLW